MIYMAMIGIHNTKNKDSRAKMATIGVKRTLFTIRVALKEPK
jgi:hypothetical protein